MRRCITAVALVLAGLTTSTAQAAFPGEPGDLLVTRSADAGISFARLDRATGRLTRIALVTGSLTPSSPEVNADGSVIAYLAFDAQSFTSSVYTMTADGLDMQEVTPDADDAGAPTWAPDGRLAYVYDANGDRRIVISDADGSNRVDFAKGRGPAWSPDGTTIAYVRGDHRIFVAPAAGGQATMLAHLRGVVEDLDWAPDGSRLVFLTHSYSWGQSEIRIIDVDGSNLRPISDTPRRLEDEPHFSPAGDRVAFLWTPKTFYRRINVSTMNTDGTGGHLVRKGTFWQVAWLPRT
jgi:Tol biopolymer transport system component